MSIRSSSEKSEAKRKIHLTEYMKKLSNHLLQDNTLQLQIFQGLNANDLEMLFESLVDDNLELRRSAAKFICYLIYQNEKIQRLLLEKEKVCLNTGNFIIGGLPSKVAPKNYGKILRMVNSLKQGPTQEPTLCWLLNVDTYQVTWRYWKDDSMFFDPACHVFGVFMDIQTLPEKKPLSKQFASKRRQISQTASSKPETSTRVAKKPISRTVNSFK